MAIKLDLEQAYDKLEWASIKQALHSHQFPPRWVDLIMECITTPTLGVLIINEKLCTNPQI